MQTRRLVPILIVSALSMLTFVPASAQDPAVPTECIIDVMGSSCEFLCVEGKSTSMTATGVTISAVADCPGGGDATCSTIVGNCAGGTRVGEGGVGTCRVSGTFVYRTVCKGAV